ncbi:hypothetical protein D3C87_1700190 [compost metagenome]
MVQRQPAVFGSNRNRPAAHTGRIPALLAKPHQEAVIPPMVEIGRFGDPHLGRAERFRHRTVQSVVFAVNFIREYHDVLIFGSQHKSAALECPEIPGLRQAGANAVGGGGAVSNIIDVSDLSYARILNSPRFQSVFRKQGRRRLDVEMNAVFASRHPQMG